MLQICLENRKSLRIFTYCKVVTLFTALPLLAGLHEQRTTCTEFLPGILEPSVERT